MAAVLESEVRAPGLPPLPPLSAEALKFADDCLASLPDERTLSVKCIRQLMATAYDCGVDMATHRAELAAYRAGLGL